MKLVSTQPRILVVDDEPLIRGYVRDIAEAAGYVVEEAKDADEAIDLLRNNWALVVTDIEMPGSMNGLKLCWHIHARCPSVGLIVMSGRCLPRPEEIPLAAEMLTKPFTPDRLIQAVRAVLGAT